MIKKNFLLSMLAIMMVALVGAGLVACGSDDEKNDNNSIVGTWVCVETSGSNGYYRTQTITLNIMPGGKGTWATVSVYEYNGQQNTSRDSGDFTYTFNGTSGKVTIREKGSYGYEDHVRDFTVSGNKLTVYGGGGSYSGSGSSSIQVFTKQ